MTYRFEEEDFKNLYVLEDYYCTNPFCDCNHVTISLCDKEDHNNRFSFLLNFNKVHGNLPNHPELASMYLCLNRMIISSVTSSMNSLRIAFCLSVSSG